MVSTRNSKGQSPSQSQDAETTGSPGSNSSNAQSSPNSSRNSKRKRAKTPNKPEAVSPTSGPESPKSDSSAREKMRKTKIEEPGEATTPPEFKRRKTSESPVDEMADVRSGELSPNSKGRKRAHDEIASTTKESKDSVKQNEERPPSRASNGEPLGKKLRETPSPPRDSNQKTTPKKADDSKEAVEPEKKSAPKETEVKLTGGFANTSAVSPFGTLASNTGEKKAPDDTSKSPFETSSFGSFAKSSSASAFGVASATLGPSPFGGPPTGANNVFSQMSAGSKSSAFPAPPSGNDNVFAKMSTGATSSGFGSSGFGSVKPSGFGSTASPFGGDGSSVFGAPLAHQPTPKAQPLDVLKPTDKSAKDEDAASEGGDDNDATSETADSRENDASKNNAPAKPALKSGEEGYISVFQARGKLFELTSAAWKERGIGNIKVLSPLEEFDADDGEQNAPKKAAVARIVMRQEGVGRLILNTNIFKNMLVSSKLPNDNVVQFMAINSVAFVEQGDNKSKDNVSDTSKPEKSDAGEDEQKSDEHQKTTLRTYLLRVKGADLAKTFREHVEENYP